MNPCLKFGEKVELKEVEIVVFLFSINLASSSLNIELLHLVLVQKKSFLIKIGVA
jgi:hypothetical protein